MPRSALGALAVSLSLSIGAPLDAQDTVLRTYDLRSLLATPAGVAQRFDIPSRAPLVLPAGPVLPRGQNHRVDVHFDSGRVHGQKAFVPVIESDVLVAWLETLWREAGAASFLDGRLRVDAPASVHARLREELAALEDLIVAPVRIAVHALPPAALAGQGAVLDADRVAALLAAHAPRSTATTAVPFDVPAFLETGQARRFVRDIDVEVAQKVSTTLPRTDVYFEGDRLGVAVTPMADGRLLVRAGMSRSDTADFARRPTGTELGGELHLPAVDFARASFAAAVPDGGGVVVDGLGGEGAARWLVVAASPQSAGRGVAAIPLGHAVVPPLQVEDIPDAIVAPGEYAGLFGRATDQPFVPTLSSLLEVYAGEALADETLAIQQIGTRVILRGNDGIRERFRDRLAQEAAELKTWSVRLRMGAVAQAAARENADRLAEMLSEDGGEDGVVGALTGHRFSLDSGRERAVVRGLESSIAQEASGMNPVVDAVYSGAFLRGMVETSASGRPILSYDFLWADTSEEEPFDIGGKGRGRLDCPRTAVVSDAGRLPLDPGAWHVLVRRPDPRDPARTLVLMARVD